MKPLAHLSIIVAIDKNRGIGKNNQLPWHLPADLKYFKNRTTGHSVVMGRKTFESMGRALPNRNNIVISRQHDLQFDQVTVVHSLESAVTKLSEDAEAFIIGGAQIFEQALPLASTLYITEIHESFDTDTFFPPINPQEWTEIDRLDYQPDDRNKYPYSFITYKKTINNS